MQVKMWDVKFKDSLANALGLQPRPPALPPKTPVSPLSAHIPLSLLSPTHAFS